jgi:hypothetical protein
MYASEKPLLSVLYIPYLDVLLCLQNALPLPMQGDAVVS